MNLRSLARGAVDSYLRLARLPIERGVRLVARSEDAATGAEIAVDRGDAAVRAAVGSLLRDPELRADATRRRIAADERERALHLRLEAERTTEQADEEFSRRQQLAEERRIEAERRAQAEKAEAERRAREQKQRVEQTERQQKAATRRAVTATEERLESQSREARLEQLEREAEALAEKEKALETADAAQRLKRAATGAKAARKTG